MNCFDCGGSNCYARVGNGQLCESCYARRCNDLRHPHFGVVKPWQAIDAAPTISKERREEWLRTGRCPPMTEGDRQAYLSREAAEKKTYGL